MFGWKAEFLFNFISFLASRKGSTEKVPKLGGVFFGTCVLKSKSEACFQIWPPGSPSTRRSQMEVTRCLFVRLFINVRNKRPHAVYVGVNCTRVNESHLACHLHIIYNIRELGKAGRTWLGSVIK